MGDGAGARSGRRYAPSLYGRTGDGTRGRRCSYAEIPIPLYGGKKRQAGFARGGCGDGGGSRASRESCVFRFAGAGGREVLWREYDFDGRCRGKSAASGGTHLFRISAASAEAARNETRGTSVEGEATDAVLARDARRPGRPGIAAADLQGVGRASDTTRDGWSGSFVSRTEEIGEYGCGSVAGARGDNRGVGEKLPRIALPSRFPFLSGHFESSGLNAKKGNLDGRAIRGSFSPTPRLSPRAPATLPHPYSPSSSVRETNDPLHPSRVVSLARPTPCKSAAAIPGRPGRRASLARTASVASPSTDVPRVSFLAASADAAEIRKR